MRIFTYPDPFKIKDNSKRWDIISKYPHFCASDTLLQGLVAQYKRESFGILMSVESLVNKVIGEWVNNPQNDIQLFLDVSNEIRNLPDEKMKQAFRFNIAEVVQSIKFLVMLECESDKFQDDISEEQKYLLQIYEAVKDSSAVLEFKKLSYLSKDKIIESIRLTVNEEIEYLCNRDLAKAKSLGIKLPILTHQQGVLAISKIIKDLEEKIEAETFTFEMTSYEQDLEKAKHIRGLLLNDDNEVYEKIIIHGVHRITPEMYFLFKLLEKNGIEVIFLINYAKNLPKTYQTWKEVYSWCDTSFEFEEEVLLPKGDNLGVALANVMEGRPQKAKPKEKVYVFNNLTSFTDREVRKTFKRADEKLSDMKTQYYAVRGQKSNEILKVYFPDQFNEKPFLSYPIGQFILGIYSMWDFTKGELCFNEANLNECAVSNIYTADINVFEVVNKVKLYFSDCETFSEYKARIAHLSKTLKEINDNVLYLPLKKISFFNITLHELQVFSDFLDFINNIGERLFKGKKDSVDYGEHFGELIKIISTPTLNSSTISASEKDLLESLTQKLMLCADGEVTGNIEDVKDALAFYLSVKNKGDTSNWIVRNFEQIDGAVLLSKRSRRKYHFACLSNSQMTKQPDDVLTWPLTNEMFNGYTHVEGAVPVINKGLLERRNFLKFSLFYGALFTKCDIELSYIVEEDGKEQTPYYLLNVLGLEMVPYKERDMGRFIDGNIDESLDYVFSTMKVDEEEKELFSICPYKFLQHVVFKSPIEYRSAYHIKYFLANYMYYHVTRTVDMRTGNKTAIEKQISEKIKSLKTFFPFWDEIIFTDIENTVSNQLKGFRFYSSNNNVYQRRKENFLIAKWGDNGQNQMDFNKPNLENLMDVYMHSPALYPSRNELPHRKVCENCNYTAVCLRDYYDALANYEDDDYE